VLQIVGVWYAYKRRGWLYLQKRGGRDAYAYTFQDFMEDSEESRRRTQAKKSTTSLTNPLLAAATNEELEEVIINTSSEDILFSRV